MLNHLLIKQIASYYSLDELEVEADFHEVGESIDKLITKCKCRVDIFTYASRCAFAINEGYNVETSEEIIKVFIGKRFFTTIQSDGIKSAIKKSKGINNCVMIVGNKIIKYGNNKLIKI